VVSPLMGPRLQPRRGRALSLSPAWPDESARIVFDRHSGDFWLLTNPAADLLASLLAEPRELPASDTVAELLRADLIQAVG